MFLVGLPLIRNYASSLASKASCARDSFRWQFNGQLCPRLRLFSAGLKIFDMTTAIIRRHLVFKSWWNLLLTSIRAKQVRRHSGIIKQTRTDIYYWGYSGAAWRWGTILTSHPEARAILCIPKKLLWCCWDLLMALVRGKWKEAWKYWPILGC